MNAFVRTKFPVDSSVVWGLALFAGAAILYPVNPQTGLSFLQCPCHQLSGIHCPGCGTLRAVHSLLHGNIGDALGFNALTVLSLPLLFAMFVERASRSGWGGALPKWQVTGRVAPFVPWVVGTFWFLRNLPFYPFSILAP